jgi:TonB family protein
MLPRSIRYGWLAAVILGAPLRIYAQQADPSPNSNHQDNQSPVPTASTTASPKTVNGIAVCPGDWKSQVLPEGVYRVGGEVKQPQATSTPAATFSDESRNLLRERPNPTFDGKSVIRLTVDSTGMPQDICVNKQAGYGLDKQAVKVVKKYRFKPATLNGKPVPVRIAVVVDFKLY